VSPEPVAEQHEERRGEERGQAVEADEAGYGIPAEPAVK
jgi:hypothetical protein